MLFAETKLFALVASPEVKCVAVASNGDVTITWIPSTDPLSEFNSYNVYVSNTLGGPYTLQASVVGIASNTYIHSGAGANLVPKFYYIESVSSGPLTSPALDTVRSIFLSVNNPGNGIAYLNWNPVQSPLSPSSTGLYKVYKEYPTGVWTFIGDTTGLKFFDTISVCSAFINYRIEIDDNTGCSSVSNECGSLFSDFTPPQIPGIDSVSINLSGQAIIGMSPSASADATCYVVYKKQGTTLIPLDTVCGNVPTVYTNVNSIASGISETYVIASIDSCNNISPVGSSQSTIFLQTSYDICDKSVQLRWNPYIGMPGGVGKYQIFSSQNGFTFTFVGDTTTTTYTIHGLNPGNTYCFFVRAINSSGTISSSSNRTCFYAATPALPSFAYIKSVDVNFWENIEVNVLVDNSATITGVKLFRSDSLTGTYSYVGYAPGNMSGNYQLIDEGLKTKENDFYYYVELLDSCGLTSISSLISKSILLKVVASNDMTNHLEWTPFQQYNAGIQSYAVYRAADGIFDATPIALLPDTVLKYDDDVSDKVANGGKFSYIVEALEDTGNVYGIRESSASNVSDSYQPDQLFIPNAFCPKGKNRLFLPITQFVEKTDYQLKIFNRWGEQIWSTESDEEGWDGGGKEGGLYIYHISYKNAIGEFKEISGTVMMIR